MSENPLASYFKQSNDPFDQMTGANDVSGRSFFDIIAECQDFNEKGQVKSELDEFYDKWPFPSSGASASAPDQFQLAIQEHLADPVKLLVNKYLGPQETSKRVLPNAESVQADANGLQILIKCGCFRSVINLTNKILKSITAAKQANPSASIHTPYSMQVWFVRIAILMKLKFFREAEIELKQFENFEKPCFFYETYPNENPDRKGSMVPFGLRMLNAELPLYLARSEESISNLYRLLQTTDLVIRELPRDNENALKIWAARRFKILSSIANILVYRKNYEKALSVLKQIAEAEFSDRCSIWSCIGKIYIQPLRLGLVKIGDIRDASSSFLNAQTHSRPGNKSDSCRNLINLSLLKIVNGQYTEAFELLKEANELVPHNSTLINNMAFCLFYSGKLREAIAVIEKHVHSSPSKNLNESLLFNLCTLYELESSKAQQKKLGLLSILNIHAGDGFYEPCLQLQ